MPYLRLVWQVRAIRSCAIHQASLVTVAEVTSPQLLHDHAQVIGPRLDELEKWKAAFVGAGEVVLGRKVSERRGHSIHSAAKESGLHPKTLRKALKHLGIIDSRSDALTDHWVILNARQVEPLLAELKRAMNLRDAAAFLGLPRPLDRMILLHDPPFIAPLIGRNDLDLAVPSAVGGPVSDRSCVRRMGCGRRRREPPIAEARSPTRLEQACDYEVMIRISQKHPRFFADRVVAYTFKDPAIERNAIIAPGEALRSKGERYHLSYKYETGPRYLMAHQLQYRIGQKVPRDEWSMYNLND